MLPCCASGACKNPPRGGFLPLAGVGGFTLIELVTVIVIMGILAVVVLPKWNGNSGFDERGFRDRVVAGLRYAQKSAIATRRTVCAGFSAPPARVTIEISTANGAANCAVGVPLVGPDSAPLVVTAANGVSFAALPDNIVFDAAGRPGAGALINISGLDPSLIITVEAESGYVH